MGSTLDTKLSTQRPLRDTDFVQKCPKCSEETLDAETEHGPWRCMNKDCEYDEIEERANDGDEDAIKYLEQAYEDYWPSRW